MPSFETLVLVAVVLAGLATLVFVLVALSGRDSRATSSLDSGRFEEAVELGSAPGAERDQKLAAAMAARHLERFAEALRLLEDLVEADPRDGEAWLELGLVEAHRGRFESAHRAFDRVSASRSDLLEPLTLHRAWLALEEGDESTARRHFDEIEVPLENKLRQEIGPGDAIFADWFLEAGLLWRHRGDDERAHWALEAARRAAPRSRLVADRAH
ncbi:MAG: tetratricopeptide repeat protein [Thermoanaerobaculia bacterium]|nr:tetratricopeptide repeat protein [Thermoanaerobaculia bacterium]